MYFTYCVTAVVILTAVVVKLNLPTIVWVVMFPVIVIAPLVVEVKHSQR